MLTALICTAVAAEINYGASEIYTRADMNSAIELIHETFGRWRGCELHNIRYVGDACNSAENIRWMNSLAKGQGYDANFTQCIEFLSDFYVSPEVESSTAFNLDCEYTNWQWWLARAEGGEWKLLTFGY